MYIIIIVSAIMSLIFPFLAIYISTKRSVNTARKDNMSKIDFSKEKEYYRTILEKYSLAELSYIDDFKVNYKREVVSTILSLELKGKIKIENNGIIVLNNDEENLRKTEKFVLKSINNGKVIINDSGYIESYAQDEALEDELIIKNSDEIVKKRVIKKAIEMVIKEAISLGFFAIFCINCEKLNDASQSILVVGIIVGIFSFFVVMFYFTYNIIGMFVYYFMQINSYRRTEKGEEINKKIEGLKQYITDYSLLREKDKEALVVWKQYLIYSVLFDINDTNIVQKISDFVEFEYERGKIYLNK